MTISEAKGKLIAWATAQIGTREGPDNENPYADVPGIRKLYGWNVQNQPWCDIFVDAGFITCFGYDLGSAMTYQYAGCAGAACAQSAAYYKAHDAFYKEPQEPETGDQVFFISGNGINHTGLVVRVADRWIETIEGNTSDSVQRRTYAFADSKIAGYGRPNWKLVETGFVPTEPETPADQEPEPEPVQTVTVTVTLPVLNKGDSGAYVKIAQALLEVNGCTCGWYGADGDFGPATDQAVRNFQIARHLHVDGGIGEQTWTALLGGK